MAYQYWSGTKDTHDIKNLSWAQYKNKSLQNWIGAARGVKAVFDNPEILKHIRCIKYVRTNKKTK